MSTPYDADHQRRRAELLPAAYGTRCPLCPHLMLRGQALDLDHSTPLAVDPTSKGDRIVHATCNRSVGGRLARTARDLRPSRRW